MNVVESINLIIEQYILRSTSSISRVYDPNGRIVNSRPISTYNGPTRGIIRNIDSNNNSSTRISNDQIRRDIIAGRYYRFKSKNRKLIKSKKLDN